MDRSLSPDSFFRVTTQMTPNSSSYCVKESNWDRHNGRLCVLSRVCEGLQKSDHCRDRAFHLCHSVFTTAAYKIPGGPVFSIPDMEAWCCHHYMSEAVWTSELLNTSNIGHHWTWPIDSWINNNMTLNRGMLFFYVCMYIFCRFNCFNQ